MSEDILLYLQQQLEKYFDEYACSRGVSEASQVRYSNNKINTIQQWVSQDIGILAVLGKKVGVTTLKKFDRKSVDETMKHLVHFTKSTRENTEYMGIAQGPFIYKHIHDTYDKKIAEVDMVKIVEEGITTCQEAGALRTAGELETSQSHVRLLTSGDIDATEEGTAIHFSMRGLIDKDASGHVTATGRTLKDFNYLEAARQAGTIATMAQHPKHISAGKYQVLFAPLAFADLLQTAAEAASIFSVEAGLSYFAQMLGKKCASKEVTFVDDATIPGGLGSSTFDSEGVPSKRTAIIENGIFKQYLHNTSTAKRYKTETTANAGILTPEPRNVILEAGDYSYNELLHSIKKGLLITNIWYTRFQDNSTGQFSTIPRDGMFYIKNGAIQYPVKGIRISDTMPNILKNISKVGDTKQQIHSWETEIPVTTPYAVVDQVHITKPVDGER